MAGVAQLFGALSCTPKGLRFDPQSGYIPSLQVRSPVMAHAGGNWLNEVHLHSLKVSLSPSPSQIKSMSLGEDFLK